MDTEYETLTLNLPQNLQNNNNNRQITTPPTHQNEEEKLFGKLLKPIVFQSTYEELKNYFIRNTNTQIRLTLNNEEISNILLKSKNLYTFETNNSARLSLVTKEEIVYTIFASYITIIKQFIITPIRELQAQEFQYFQSISIFLLKNNVSKIEEEVNILQQLITNLTNALEDNTLPEERRFAVIDIFLHACQNQQQREQLEAEIELYRQRNLNLNNIRQTSKRKDKYEISTDTQNVHDIVLNTLYRRKCILIEKDIIPDESINTTIKKYYDLRIKHSTLLDKIKNTFGINKDNFAFNRIKTDLTVFSPTRLTLSDIFQRVFYRIVRLQHTDYFPDILQRIEEECIEMQETCATGHMTRLLNMLSGYPEVDIEVVSFYVDEMIDKLRKTFESLFEDDEGMMDSYISFDEKERSKFDKYIRSKNTIEEYYAILKREYILEKKTHNEFLFKEDFVEAYSKFGNFQLDKELVRI